MSRFLTVVLSLVMVLGVAGCTGPPVKNYETDDQKEEEPTMREKMESSRDDARSRMDKKMNDSDSGDEMEN